MNTTTYNISADAARLLALREAGLTGAEFQSVSCDGRYWELEFTADELYYTCYVDAETGEVVGLSSEPMLLHPTEQYDTKFEFLYGSLNFIA